jgi:hypothetical protein
MVNFLNLKVVLFCEQEYIGVNMLPEVPKIEMAKEKKRVPKILERQLTFRVQPSDGATALNPGFGRRQQEYIFPEITSIDAKITSTLALNPGFGRRQQHCQSKPV